MIGLENLLRRIEEAKMSYELPPKLWGLFRNASAIPRAEGVGAEPPLTPPLAICLKKIADFVWGYRIVDEGDGLTEPSKTHNNALAIAIGEILDPQDNVPLVDALKTYAAAGKQESRSNYDISAEKAAQLFHELYECYAPNFGYETRKESAVPWDEVPEQNKQLMIAVCKSFLAAINESRCKQESPLPLEDGEGFDESTEARWQNRIYELCKKLVGRKDAYRIDGSGCESGDALDVTISEIKQTFAILEARGVESPSASPSTGDGEKC